MRLNDLIDARIRAAMASRRPPFRGRVTSIKRGPEAQLMQVLGLNGENLQDVELFQHFGFTSCLPSGTQLVVIPIGGNTAHCVAVASERTSTRPQLLPGESALYNDQGDFVRIHNGRIVEVKASMKVIIDAPQAVITHDLQVGGNITCAGSMTVEGDIASDGDIGAAGSIAAAADITDSVGSMAAMRTAHNTHLHPIPGGDTGTPTVLMGGS